VTGGAAARGRAAPGRGRDAAGQEPHLASRLLVVADDLGYDPEIDRGILLAHEKGIVTAASAMVDTPFSAAALQSAPDTLAVGLHLVVPTGSGRDRAGEEISRQVERFEALRGRPSHVDGHRHVHAVPEVLEALLPWAAAAGVRVRALSDAMRERIRQAGAPVLEHFLGDALLRPCWTRERLLAALAELPAGDAELMCHPGFPPTRVQTSFGAERQVELEALCDPEARRVLGARGTALVGRL